MSENIKEKFEDLEGKIKNLSCSAKKKVKTEVTSIKEDIKEMQVEHDIAKIGKLEEKIAKLAEKVIELEIKK